MEATDFDAAMGLIRGAIAIVSMVTFLGICWWAYAPGNRGRFEGDGWLAFEPDEIKAHQDEEQAR